MQGLKQVQMTQLVDTYKERMKTAQMTKNKIYSLFIYYLAFLLIA